MFVTGGGVSGGSDVSVVCGWEIIGGVNCSKVLVVSVLEVEFSKVSVICISIIVYT